MIKVLSSLPDAAMPKRLTLYNAQVGLTGQFPHAEHHLCARRHNRTGLRAWASELGTWV